MSKGAPADRYRILIIVGLAVLLRGGIAWIALDQYDADPDSYRRIAVTLDKTGVFGLGEQDGQGIPTAFRPALYPYLLSWMIRDGQLSTPAVALLHTLMGAVTVWLTILIARRLFGRQRVDLPCCLAGLMVAIDPILVRQSILVMTETFATLLSVAVIWLWVRLHDRRTEEQPDVDSSARWPAFIVISLLLALAYLCRPTFLVWSVILVVATFFSQNRSWRTRLACALSIGLVVLLAVGVWTYRNINQLGHPVWATTHGGYTLLLANNESFYDYLGDGNFGEAWDAEPFLNAYQHRYEGDPNQAAFWSQAWDNPVLPFGGVSEPEDDRKCFLAAKATIQRRPQEFLWSCVVRCARIWSPMPHHTPGRSWAKIILVGLYYSLIYVAAIYVLYRGGREMFRSKWWSIWALAITLSGVHAIYWSNQRMRAPIIPMIIVVATAALPSARKSSDGAHD